ncbi:uncharacterized protein LOC128231779 isoform X2 [Mya arenaria]|uniref:uncharacterized protein LOC128231779 isoform X2 n=1 Tax=Mya arenaria TaxID=6604 RepID=UPI0022E34D72|nr:uncharacterized protein LOC128231779 isoform X2 [Mya arenaria]
MFGSEKQIEPCGEFNKFGAAELGVYERPGVIPAPPFGPPQQAPINRPVFWDGGLNNSFRVQQNLGWVSQPQADGSQFNNCIQVQSSFGEEDRFSVQPRTNYQPCGDNLEPSQIISSSNSVRQSNLYSGDIGLYRNDYTQFNITKNNAEEGKNQNSLNLFEPHALTRPDYETSLTQNGVNSEFLQLPVSVGNPTVSSVSANASFNPHVEENEYFQFLLAKSAGLRAKNSKSTKSVKNLKSSTPEQNSSDSFTYRNESAARQNRNNGLEDRLSAKQRVDFRNIVVDAESVKKINECNDYFKEFMSKSRKQKEINEMAQDNNSDKRKKNGKSARARSKNNGLSIELMDLTFQCAECDTSYSAVDELEKHIKETHIDADDNGKVTDDVNNENGAVNDVVDLENMDKEDGAIESVGEILRLDRDAIEEPESFMCTLCADVYASQAALDEHWKVHEAEQDTNTNHSEDVNLLTDKRCQEREYLIESQLLAKREKARRDKEELERIACENLEEIVDIDVLETASDRVGESLQYDRKRSSSKATVRKVGRPGPKSHKLRHETTEDDLDNKVARPGPKSNKLRHETTEDDLDNKVARPGPKSHKLRHETTEDDLDNKVARPGPKSNKLQLETTEDDLDNKLARPGPKSNKLRHETTEDNLDNKVARLGPKSNKLRLETTEDDLDNKVARLGPKSNKLRLETTEDDLDNKVARPGPKSNKLRHKFTEDNLKNEVTRLDPESHKLRHETNEDDLENVEEDIDIRRSKPGPKSKKREVRDCKSKREKKCGMELEKTSNNRNSRERSVGDEEGTCPIKETRTSRAKNVLLNPSKGKQKRVLSPRTKEDEMLMRQFGIIPSKVCLSKVEDSNDSSSRDSVDSGARRRSKSRTPKKNTVTACCSFKSLNRRSKSTSPPVSGNGQKLSVLSASDSGITVDFSDDENDDVILIEQPVECIVLDEDLPLKLDNTEQESNRDKTAVRNLSKSLGATCASTLKKNDDADLMKKYGIKGLSVNLSPSKRKLSGPNMSPVKHRKHDNLPQVEQVSPPNVENLSDEEMEKLLHQCGMAISVSKPDNIRSSPRKRQASPEPCTSKGHGQLKRKKTARKSCNDEDLIKKFKLKESSVQLESLSKIEVSMLRNPHSRFGKSSWLQHKFDTDSESDLEWDIPSPVNLEEFVEDSETHSHDATQDTLSYSDKDVNRSAEKLDKELMDKFGLSEAMVLMEGPVLNTAQVKKASGISDEALLKKFVITNPKICVGNAAQKSKSNISDSELLKQFGIPELIVVADLVDDGYSQHKVKGSKSSSSIPYQFSVEELRKGLRSANMNFETGQSKGKKSVTPGKITPKRSGKGIKKTPSKQTPSKKSSIKSAKKIKNTPSKTPVRPAGEPTMLCNLPKLKPPQGRLESQTSLQNPDLSKDLSSAKMNMKSTPARSSPFKSPGRNAQLLKMRTTPLAVKTSRAKMALKLVGKVKESIRKGPVKAEGYKDCISSKISGLPDLKVSVSLLSAEDIEKYTSRAQNKFESAKHIVKSIVEELVNNVCKTIESKDISDDDHFIATENEADYLKATTKHWMENMDNLPDSEKDRVMGSEITEDKREGTDNHDSKREESRTDEEVNEDHGILNNGNQVQWACENEDAIKKANNDIEKSQDKLKHESRKFIDIGKAVVQIGSDLDEDGCDCADEDRNDYEFSEGTSADEIGKKEDNDAEYEDEVDGQDDYKQSLENDINETVNVKHPFDGKEIGQGDGIETNENEIGTIQMITNVLDQEKQQDSLEDGIGEDNEEKIIRVSEGRVVLSGAILDTGGNTVIGEVYDREASDKNNKQLRKNGPEDMKDAVAEMDDKFASVEKSKIASVQGPNDIIETLKEN